MHQIMLVAIGIRGPEGLPGELFNGPVVGGGFQPDNDLVYFDDRLSVAGILCNDKASLREQNNVRF